MNPASPSLGFTKAGTPRLRRPKSPARTHAEILKERHRRRCARRRRAFVALGLNTKGKPYQVRYWSNLTRLGLQGKAREAMRRKLVRQENAKAGLTVRGTVRQRRRWTGLAGKSKTEIGTIRHRDWLQRRRYDRGLTARGTPQIPATERAWRELRATMDIRRPEFLTEEAA